jgi:quinohemoprotein ethanol dehydrogenase
VIDRENGKLLAADKLGTVTWADHVDLATGRPVMVPGAKYEDKSIVLWPSFQAVHHWTPQSFSPRTGLMYEPTLEMPAEFGDTGVDRQHFNPKPYTPESTGLSLGAGDVPRDAGRSVLKAWNPLNRKVVWKVETAGVSNGGTLATAGNLVIQGLADGYLHAYSAVDGKDLWSFYAGVAVTGVPITYSVDGRQYLTITAGPLGGSTAGFGSISARFGWDPRIHPRRLLTFALDATAKLPATPPPHPAVPLEAPQFKLDPARASAGAHEYPRCVLCHGMGLVAGGIAPDLRASPVVLSAEAFAHIVHDGGLVPRGMPQFAELSPEQLDDLRHFIRQTARNDLAKAQSAAAH